MGNCLRHESEMHWAGEDWDEFLEEEDHHSSTKPSGDAQKVIVTSSEIKIRLTKKQLQDLLNKVNVHDFTFQQKHPSISCPSLNNNRGYEEGKQQGLWRPVLQSIPEAN